jgi:hypothetical protein
MCLVKQSKKMNKNKSIGSIPLFGYEYEIQLVTALRDPADGKELDGYCDYGSQTILIDTSLNETKRLSVLLHESIHAILYLSGQSQLLDDDREESLVLALEYGLAPALQKLIEIKLK